MITVGAASGGGAFSDPLPLFDPTANGRRAATDRPTWATAFEAPLGAEARCTGAPLTGRGAEPPLGALLRVAGVVGRSPATPPGRAPARGAGSRVMRAKATSASAITESTESATRVFGHALSLNTSIFGARRCGADSASSHLGVEIVQVRLSWSRPRG